MAGRRRAGKPSEHHDDVTPGLPAEGACARAHGLVGLGAHHRVHQQRLEPGVPGATHLRGLRVDLGRGEGDLAAVLQKGLVHERRIGGGHDVRDAFLDHRDRQLHECDRLVEVHNTGHVPWSHLERPDVAQQARLGVAQPVRERRDAALHDEADERARLCRELPEPGQLSSMRARAAVVSRPAALVIWVASRRPRALVGRGHLPSLRGEPCQLHVNTWFRWVSPIVVRSSSDTAWRSRQRSSL